MRTILPSFRTFFTILFTGILAFSPVLAQEAETDGPPPADPVHPGEVLVTDAVPLLLPAFHDDEMAGAKVSDLFDAMPNLTEGALPAKGRGFAGPDGATAFSTRGAAAFSTRGAAAFSAGGAAACPWNARISPGQTKTTANRKKPTRPAREQVPMIENLVVH